MSAPLARLAAARMREAVPGVTVYIGPAEERVEGTGASVIEVLTPSSWAQPKNGAQCPVLHINILSDRTRDPDGLPLKDDADQRAWVVWEAVDDLFHDTGRAWADVHSSYRRDGPTLTLIPDGDRSVLLTVRYEVVTD